MRKTNSFLSALALLAAVGAANAQDGEPVEKRFYLVGGGNFTEGDKERGANFTSGFNIGFGKRITERFALELKAAFKNFDDDATDRPDGDPDRPFNADTKSVSLDLFYHLGGYSKWDSYIVAGIGRSDYEARSEDGAGNPIEGDIDFITGEIGVGVRNEFTERGTAVRMDVRYRREQVTSGSGGFSDVDDTDFPDFDDLVINFDFVMPLGAREVDAVDRPNPDSLLDRRFYLIPSVQYTRPDGNRFADDNYGYALTFGRNYTDNASIEFRVSQNDLDGQGVELFDSFKVLSAGIDVLMHREIYPKLQPYLVLGVGYQENTIKADGADDMEFDGLTIDYGFGVQSRGYRSPVGWRFDLRNRHVNIERDRSEGIEDRTSFEDLLINVGAIIPLGPNPYKERDRKEAAERAAREAEKAAEAAAEAEAARLAAAAELAKDTDGDNVPDVDDKCPNTPAGAEVDADGCELDNDNDGVKNSKDKCPNTPEGAEVDADGCELDSDNDGVKNSKDKCPNTPAGAEVNADGCELDGDNDGVVNSKDECPNTAPGLAVDARGCTKVAQIVVLEGVNFKTDSAELTLNAKTILDAVAESLAEQPGLRVLISGHTDWVGPAAYNQRLSQKRAESVKKYLAGKGVNPSNMDTRGFGESTPVGDNKTEEGRGRNRRVELRTLSDSGASATPEQSGPSTLVSLLTD